MFDLLIKNGTVIDGLGTPRFRADVGVNGERIAAVGDLRSGTANQTIDASGRIVAPGFIDVHNHSDSWLLSIPHLVPKTTQGFTTEVIMADGISYAPVSDHTAAEWVLYLRSLNGLKDSGYSGWKTLSDYLALLDRRVAQNVATHIPYANVRSLFCGFGPGRVDDWQMKQIRGEIEKGMSAGAAGISTGLDYISECFADTGELVEVCEVMRAARGVYVTHVRYKKGTLAGVREAVEIGRRAGVPVHISHLKGTTPEEAEEILDYIDKVAVNEVDFSFDVYPYMPGSTMLNFLLPYEALSDGPGAAAAKLADPVLRWRFGIGLEKFDLSQIQIAWVASKQNQHWQGRMLSDYVASTKQSAADALCDLLVAEELAVLLVFRTISDDLVEPFLQHRCFMMGTDGIYQEDGVIHPRMFGSAPRLLGRCVRERKLFSLEEAVRKMTSLPARRFGLRGRGEIKQDSFADIVIFDPRTIADRATYEAPRQLSTGIEDVIVNGSSIIAGAKPKTEARDGWPGRALKFNS